MSHYEWESGMIKLPSAVFSKFRRELSTFVNNQRATRFQKAEVIYKNLKAQPKGKTFDELIDMAQKALAEQKYTPFASYGQPVGGDEEIERAVIDRAKHVVRRPLKKDFPMVPLACDNFGGCGWRIEFDPKRQTVHWSVGENNHAYGKAHAEASPTQFFRMLAAVNWVRGTGGEIAGNDEYNRDNSHSGGGANYTNFCYGPGQRNPRRRY